MPCKYFHVVCTDPLLPPPLRPPQVAKALPQWHPRGPRDGSCKLRTTSRSLGVMISSCMGSDGKACATRCCGSSRTGDACGRKESHILRSCSPVREAGFQRSSAATSGAWIGVAGNVNVSRHDAQHAACRFPIFYQRRATCLPKGLITVGYVQLLLLIWIVCLSWVTPGVRRERPWP